MGLAFCQTHSFVLRLLSPLLHRSRCSHLRRCYIVVDARIIADALRSGETILFVTDGRIDYDRIQTAAGAIRWRRRWWLDRVVLDQRIRWVGSDMGCINNVVSAVFDGVATGSTASTATARGAGRVNTAGNAKAEQPDKR